ncbi:hypothetical protein HK100_007734, partial [Physocladia obscura]
MSSAQESLNIAKDLINMFEEFAAKSERNIQHLLPIIHRVTLTYKKRYLRCSARPSTLLAARTGTLPRIEDIEDPDHSSGSGDDVSDI